MSASVIVSIMKNIKIMTKKLYIIQSFFLFVGTVFAWTTIMNDFIRFYGEEGTLFKIADCVYPNPVTTACFYGAIAFLIAFVWSLKILQNIDAQKRKKSQIWLVWFLLAGVIFAWTNFSIQIFNFYTALPGEQVSCSGVPTDNPYLTSCFYGSVIFLLSFISSLFVKKELNTINVPDDTEKITDEE